VGLAPHHIQEGPELVLILVEDGNRGADPQGGAVIGEREARAKQNPNPRTLTWVILKI